MAYNDPEDFVEAPAPAGTPAGTPAPAPAQQAPNFAQMPTPQGPEQMRAYGDLFRDPQGLTAIAMSFAKEGVPADRWLAAAHQAAQENLFEAIGFLDVDDAQGAVAAFNRSGRFKDVTGATKNPDGTWTIARKQGQPVTFSTEQFKRSMLSPKEFMAAQAQATEAAGNADLRKAQAGYYRDRTETRQAIAETRAQAQRDVATIRADAARAVAEARGPTGTKRKAVDANTLYHDTVQKFISTPFGSERPEESARRAVLASPDAIEPRLQDDGSVIAFNRATGEPYEIFPTLEAFQQASGRTYTDGAPKPKEKPKEPGFIERMTPNFGGSEAAKQGLTKKEEKPKTTVGEDMRRFQRFLTGRDDREQRTSSGKIR